MRRWKDFVTLEERGRKLFATGFLLEVSVSVVYICFHNVHMCHGVMKSGARQMWVI